MTASFPDQKDDGAAAGRSDRSASLSGDGRQGDSREQAETPGERAAGQAKSQFDSQFDRRAGQAADELDKLADSVRTAAAQLEDEESGTLSHYVSSLADSMSRFADNLRHRSADELLRDVRQLARRNPGLFMAGGVAIGFGLARLARVSADASHTASMDSQGVRMDESGDRYRSGNSSQTSSASYAYGGNDEIADVGPGTTGAGPDGGANAPRTQSNMGDRI